MKGKNTLKLNTETMHEAVQLWVAQEFTYEPKPNVVAVRQYPATAGYGSTPDNPGYYEIDIEASSDAAGGEAK